MAKESRENRVPIMLSQAELDAIDDWRFANRVATRSDAIRRLCQIALTSDEVIDEIWLDAYAAYSDLDARMQALSDVISRNEDQSAIEYAKEHFFGEMNSVADRLEMAVARASVLLSVLGSFRRRRDLNQALQEAANINESMRKSIQQMEERMGIGYRSSRGALGDINALADAAENASKKTKPLSTKKERKETN